MTDKLTPLQYAEAVEAALLAEGIETNLGVYLDAKVSIEAIPSEGDSDTVEALALVVDEVELFRASGESPTEVIKTIETWIFDNILSDVVGDLAFLLMCNMTPAEA